MSTATQPATAAAAKSNVNIQIYNTLSRKKEPFETITAGKVGIYLCGPTVYKEAHMGHMVGPVIFDCIKRYLVYCGYDVTWVVNITDVDDKLIAEANKRGISMEQVAEENIADYLKNLSAMGVDQIDHMPKATETMDDIIRFIEQLVEKGFAYESAGDVYFEVSKDPGYGKLSNRSAEDQQGEGGDTASRKRASGDFALWKSAKPGEPSWKSPWGEGRPGWHIECSAMSRNLLGETFDIHGGGLDLMFPHHENEIAQSECCHGKPMVKYWLHNGLMRASTATGKMGGRSEREAGAAEDVEAAAAAKISRSAGAGGLHTLIGTHGGELLRFFLLRTHYRSTIVFGDEPLAEAGTALDTFHRLFERYQRITGENFYNLQAASTRAEGEFDPAGDELLVGVKQLRDRYLTKMDDDFNTGGAVSDLFELARLLNKFADQNDLEGAGKSNATALASFGRGMSTLRELTGVLGIFREAPAAAGADSELTGKLMELLIEIRANARANKDFATGDLIRDKLTELGITLEDRKGETGWRFE